MYFHPWLALESIDVESLKETSFTFDRWLLLDSHQTRSSHLDMYDRGRCKRAIFSE